MAQKTSFKALQIWNLIPENIRSTILSNVYCVNCKDMTTIIDYSIEESKSDIVLRGKCAVCNGEVARIVENSNLS